MGQAKLRGTFEDRLRQAQERQQAAYEQAPARQQASVRKVNKAAMTALMLAGISALEAPFVTPKR